MTPRPTVVVAVHDGFYGSGTGAGYANDAFLRTLTGLLSPDVRLVVMPILLTEQSPEYQQAWHRRSVELCESAGATVLPVDNGTGGLVRFGGVPAFRHLGEFAAKTLAEQVLPTAAPLAMVCFDIPFLAVVPHLPTAVRPSFAVVPRSTGLLHDPGNAERITFERAGLAYVAQQGGRIAAISGHMKDHLLRDYAVPETALLTLADGLTPEELDQRPDELPALPPRAEAGFLFAMGRATPYKGWDDLVDALAILARRGRPVPHAVLAAVTDQPGVSEYQRRLADRIAARDLDATLLTRFDAANRALLAHPALRAVVVPSRTEPFGRIPLEAYAAGAAPVVATTAGGLAEQVVDGVTGFSAPPGDPAGLARALVLALDLAPADRDRMRAAGYRLLCGFDHRRSAQRFFAEFAPWVVRPDR